MNIFDFIHKKVHRPETVNITTEWGSELKPDEILYSVAVLREDTMKAQQTLRENISAQSLGKEKGCRDNHKQFQL